jgi:AmmeMemoRadiSam system protein B
MRLPVVAGQFYDDDGLVEQIKRCFLHPLGPGSLPSARKSGILSAAICPHAGYVFSGPCASWAYKAVAEAGLPDVFIMLGASHSGRTSCFSSDDWAVPNGTVKNDKELTLLLSDKLGIPVDERPHANEHSIEVQLPFLQFAVKSPKIVPLMVSHDLDPIELGKNLKKALVHSRKKYVVIASSDFTHYGVNYGYMPFRDDKKGNLYRLDKSAIDFILQKKTGRFLDFVDDTHATICGSLPVAVLLEAIDFEKSELLKYYTSGDLTGDYSSAVGYASIVFS